MAPRTSAAGTGGSLLSAVVMFWNRQNQVTPDCFLLVSFSLDGLSCRTNWANPLSQKFVNAFAIGCLKVSQSFSPLEGVWREKFHFIWDLDVLLDLIRWSVRETLEKSDASGLQLYLSFGLVVSVLCFVRSSLVKTKLEERKANVFYYLPNHWEYWITGNTVLLVSFHISEVL